MTELDLITRIKDQQDSTALNALVDMHTGIYVKMVRRYECYPDFRDKIEAQDIMRDKTFHIYEFAKKYDPSRGMAFGSYVGEQLSYICSNLITRSARNVEFNEDVAPSNDTSVTDNAEKDSSIEEALAQVSGSDSAKFREIFKLRFMGQKPLSWRVIGEAVDMSHEGARKLFEKHIGAVREYLKT